MFKVQIRSKHIKLEIYNFDVTTPQLETNDVQVNHENDVLSSFDDISTCNQNGTSKYEATLVDDSAILIESTDTRVESVAMINADIENEESSASQKYMDSNVVCDNCLQISCADNSFFGTTLTDESCIDDFDVADIDKSKFGQVIRNLMSYV